MVFEDKKILIFPEKFPRGGSIGDWGIARRIDNAPYNHVRYDCHPKKVITMAQTNLTIRIDENVKQEAEILFDKIGLTMSAAINVFFRQAIREQAIPFPLRAKTADEKYSEYFTPEIMCQ